MKSQLAVSWEARSLVEGGLGQKKVPAIYDLGSLLIPIVFLALGVFDGLANFEIGTSSENIAFAAVQLLFFNHIHIYFTFILLAQTQAFRAWRAEQIKRDPYFLVRISILFLFLVLISALMDKLRFEGLLEVKFGIIACISAIGFHHLIAQSFGVWLIWAHERHERQQSKGAIMVARGFVWTTTLSYPLLVFDSYANCLSPTARLAVMSCNFLIGLLVVVFSWRLYRSWNLTIYSARFLLYPMATALPILMYGAMAAHGVESLILFRKLRDRTPSDQKSPREAWVMLGVGLATVLATTKWPFVKAFLEAVDLKGSKALDVISAVSFALVYMHYHLEGHIYRMKDPCSREHILPELKGVLNG